VQNFRFEDQLDLPKFYAYFILLTATPFQVAMYTTYKRIIELCPAQVWKPEILLKLLCLPKPCSKLIECIRVVISKFGQDFFTLDDSNSQSSPQARSENFDLPKVGQKRISQNEESSFSKRQKMTESGFSAGVGFKLREDYGYAFRQSLFSLIKSLSPDNYETYPLDPETAIEVISLLCLSLCVYSKTSLFTRVSKQVLSWISWIHKQVGKSSETSMLIDLACNFSFHLCIVKIVKSCR
jgi:serine/threonine-protein kinase ATR